MQYKKIRRFSYLTEKKVLKSDPHNFDMNNWLKSPYTCLKVRFYIEVSSILVYFLQFTKVKPNQITYLYALSGFLGGIFLASNENEIILLGLAIIFSKVAIDGTDGLLARVKYKPTKFGSIIDRWAGLVGEYSFIFGFGFYLFNDSQDISFLYLTFIIIFLKAIDLNQYLKFFEREKLRLKNFTKNKENKVIKLKVINFIKFLFNESYNYNAKTVDVILFLICVDVLIFDINFIKYFFYLYFLRGSVIFLGNILLANKKINEK